MKRIAWLIPVIILAAVLMGCHYSDSGDILEPVEYYYPRKSSAFVYGSGEGVIASEIREASGHVGDLHYLISMYLRGPQDSALRSPFPSGSKLESIRIEEQVLHIFLSSESHAPEGTDMTLACAALAKTCLAMTTYESICINAEFEAQTISMMLDDESLLFADYSAFDPEPTTTAPQ